MSDALPDMLLRPRQAKWLLIVAGSLVFTVVGAFMTRDGKTEGYLGLVFFGLCTLTALAQLLPNSAYLRLTRDGFEVRSLCRSSQTRWSDVSEFRAGRLGPSAAVVFDFAPSYARARRMRTAAAALAGAEGAIPDTYGYRATDLAALLNEWRDRAIQTRRS